jgi:hypothetical protein
VAGWIYFMRPLVEYFKFFPPSAFGSIEQVFIKDLQIACSIIKKLNPPSLECTLPFLGP